MKALALLGPADADEAAKVRAQLVQDYPREARAAGVVVGAAVTRVQSRDAGHPGDPASNDEPLRRWGTRSISDPTHDG